MFTQASVVGQYIHFILAICRAYLFTLLQKDHALLRTTLYSQTSRQTYYMTRHER